MAAIKHPQLDGVKINKDGTLPYQVLQAFKKAYEQIELLSNSSASANITVIEDTHINRNLHPAVGVALGSLYLETDTGLLYVCRTVTGTNAWVYQQGVYSRTQAQLSTYAALLTTVDAGVLVNVSDYAHLLRWSGSVWQWGPGEQGSGFFAPFAVAPTGSGWHACDGSVGVTYLKADGTTGAITLPDTAGSAAYAKASAAYASTITAATVPAVSQPTFSGSALAAHRHTIPIGVSGGFIEVDTAQNVAAVWTANIQTAWGASSAAQTLKFITSSDSAGTPAGTVSQPTATLPADPVASFSVILYFRQ